jgi:flagellar assembly factor FliW
MARTAESRSRPASADVVHVSSRRFGDFEVPCNRILEFPQGLIGFGALHRFVILEHRPGSPFKWMLSLDDPELAFAVADPIELVCGYVAPLDVAARILATEPAEIALFVLVTIPGDPAAMTVNLMAPVAVDLKTRRARQLVLEDARFPAAYSVVGRTRIATP